MVNEDTTNQSDKQPKVSLFYGGATGVIPSKELSWPEVVRIFTKDQEIKRIVEEVRAKKQAGDEKGADEAKSKLPYITPSGTYTYRNDKSLIPGTYNWVCPIDIDFKDNPNIDWVQLFKSITADPCVFLCVHSSRGQGLKAISKLAPNGYDPQDQYNTFRDVVYPYYEKIWGCKIDYQQGALSQPFYVTFDANGYVNINPKAQYFDYTMVTAEAIINGNVSTQISDLKPFVRWIHIQERDKWQYFGKVAMWVGGLFSGKYFSKDLKEAEILNSLVDAARTNKFIKDADVAEKQIRESFATGKQNPLDKKTLSAKQNISTIIKRLAVASNPVCQFIRSGNDFFKKGHIVNQHKKEEPTLLGWKRQTIIDDFGADYIEQIPKYDAFCNVPNNINYEGRIKGCYNLYASFQHSAGRGDYPTIETLFKHVFGDQLQMGYDYVQLLYKFPTQVLPILCLVSQEQGTGKTTFLEFLAELFLGNVAIVGTADIEGPFNQHFISKLVIAVDESNLHKEDNTSKIKQMATQFSSYRKAKFQDESKIGFFAKLILASNSERNFINIKDEDIRYWIRKLSPIEKFDKDFEAKLRTEIPAFLYFLQNRTMETKTKQSRAWFDVASLNTEWLDAAKEQGHTTLWFELNDWFYDWFANNPHQTAFTATAKQIQNCVLDRNREYNVKYISGVMRDEFKIETKLMRAIPSFPESSEKIGRYFTIYPDKIGFVTEKKT